MTLLSDKLLHLSETMSSTTLSLKQKLMKPTSLFGAKLWVLLVTFTVLFTLLVIVFVLVIYIIRYRRHRKSYNSHLCVQNPIASKVPHIAYGHSSLDRRLLSLNMSEIEMNNGKERQTVLSDQLSSTGASGITPTSAKVSESESRYSSVVKDVWRGDKFTLRELEAATNGFGRENLIGNGDYGIVYHGILFDNIRVAVKRLVSDSCHEDDFIAEMEAIGHVRHKNLVKMLGYRIERAYRLLVHEYVDNKSLHHWLHECSRSVSPLTWDIRMKIIHGIAKGLAYLHEDIEPKIFHRSLISSNVLLDHQWDPKISDFGLAKLYSPAWGITIMESLGYVAPEYAATGDFNEKSDVYSFGVLIMEIISGRTPIDRTQHQPYLVDWLKSMVASQRTAYVVDPKLPEKPSSKELKRVLLVALRCTDPDLEDRPRMGEVLHMLEPRDLLMRDDRWLKRSRDCSSSLPTRELLQER
ncbi:probable serine/threonine-protein kinase At1g01540 [Rosa rugosa]|uniref:probable serine/threonine-protein kinase At1g01540 n=1 Tax=Rosa rugosa TaxID=74645 RepID=UPI002B402030|nr:probable serine/threonine-protein kinase At1g01540 [Rosa rugosa]